MIVQRFHLDKIGWVVTVYYAVTGYYVNEIISKLRRIGCEGEILEKAYHQLHNCRLDTGLTYSNPSMRESVIVISLSSTAAEFNNSLQHEQRHLERQIADHLGIDPNSEGAAYLAGDIAEAMFPYAKHLMCDCCRKKTYKRHLLLYER